MADTKISAMTAATVVASGGEFPLVAGGANLRATRQLMLTAGAGEVIELLSATGQPAKLRAVSGNARVDVKDNGDIDIRGTGTIGMFDNGITYGIMVQAGGFVVVQSSGAGGSAFVGKIGGPSMLIDNFTAKVTFVATAGMVCPYIDGTAAAWLTAPPADYNTAIDRIANAVAGLLVGQIP